MRFREKIKLVGKSNFIKSAGVLVSGSAFAQGLSILMLPIVTRLYTPEEFSILAMYVALLTVMSAIACLRLEIAIPLPSGDSEAVNLLALSLLFVIVTTLSISLFVFFFSTWFFQTIGQPQLRPFSWLLPVGVALAGSYAAFQFWCTRKKRFYSIARTRVIQSCSGNVTEIGLGWIGAGSIGLLLGHTLMVGAGAINLAQQIYYQDRVILSKVSRVGMARALSKFRHFPQYSTLEAFANNAAMQVPIILIAVFSMGAEAGYALLAIRVMGAPVSLLGGAVAQVFLSQAPEKLREGQLHEFTTGILKTLAIFSAPPLVFLAIIAPYVFPWVFGEEWRRAGELVSWMMPWFILKLLSSPISMVMHVKMMQKAMLILTCFGFGLRVGVVCLAIFLLPQYLAEAYAISGAVFYGVAMYVFLRVARDTKVAAK